MDLLLPGLWTSVPASDSLGGVIVEAVDIIEAIEKVLPWSTVLLVEVMVCVRVCVPGIGA
jgi:hypothetical protein